VAAGRGVLVNAETHPAPAPCGITPPEEGIFCRTNPCLPTGRLQTRRGDLIAPPCEGGGQEEVEASQGREG